MRTYEEDRAHAERCLRDPVFWAKETYGLEPTAQQHDLLMATAMPGAHVAAASGHGIGKSTALAALALWFLATRKDAKVPCTAPTAHQLKDVLWHEIRSAINRMSPWMRDQFTVTRDMVRIKGSDGFIVARTVRPESPDALQGFHGEHLLFIIDEAAGVDEKVYEVAYGALSTDKARVVCTGNPTSLSGFFYKVFHTQNSWKRFNFSCLDSPIVDKKYAALVANDYGKDSDAYRIRVLGQFPLHGKSTIIAPEDVRLAFSRKPNEEIIYQYPAVIGVDPAWVGEDRSVIALRRGTFSDIVFTGVHLDGDQLSRKVAQVAASTQSRYIFVDSTGVGASCCDFLKMRDVRHTRVSFSATPDDPKMFINKRIEMWWRLRQWMNQEDTSLVSREGLLEDLTSPEYGVRDNGKMYMESKEDMRRRGIRSPDLGDALAMTFFLPYELTTYRFTNNGVTRNNNVLEERREEWRREALGSPPRREGPRRRISLLHY